jgi:AraC-like DNA-binding protein
MVAFPNPRSTAGMKPRQKKTRRGNGPELEATVRRAILQVEAEQISDNPFSNFECRQFNLPGGLVAYDLKIDPVVINRSMQHICADANNDYFLTTLLEGRARIRQADKEYTLKPGDLALMAGGLPYTIRYERPSRRLLVRIPVQVFTERLLGREQNLVIGSLPNEGLGRIVIDLLKSVALEAERLSITDQYTLAQSLLELAGALTRASLKSRGLKPVPKQSELLNRIFAYLEANYINPDLTPEIVAAANGISTRYLHSLFGRSGTTVLRWVWERRLRAARSDLLDPSQSQLRVSEIAFRRGFSDSAHFSRSFRHRFGVSPTQLRDLAAPAGTAK